MDDVLFDNFGDFGDFHSGGLTPTSSFDGNPMDVEGRDHEFETPTKK